MSIMRDDPLSTTCCICLNRINKKSSTQRLSCERCSNVAHQACDGKYSKGSWLCSNCQCDEYKEGAFKIGDLVRVKPSQYSKAINAIEVLEVLGVLVEDGIIKEVELKWDSRPNDPEWVLSERVSEVIMLEGDVGETARPSRSCVKAAFTSTIPVGTVVDIKWGTKKTYEVKVIEFLPIGKGDDFKQVESYLVEGTSGNWEAEVCSNSIILRSTEKSPSRPPPKKRKVTKRVEDEDEDEDETPSDKHGQGSITKRYVDANGKNVVKSALEIIEMTLKRARLGKYDEKKINVFSLAGGKGSEIDALLQMGIPPSKIRCFVSELMSEGVVMGLRMKLVRQGVEHYWLGPLGDPEMNTRIDTYEKDFGPADLCFASPPCQDFSLANPERRGLAGENGKLFPKAVEVIKKLGEQRNETFVWIIENTNMEKKDRDKLDEICGVAAFKSDAREVYSSCLRERLIWTNFLLGPLTKNPDGDLANVLVNRSVNAVIGGGSRVEGESYFLTIKASGHGNKVVEGKRVSKPTLLELERLHAISSTTRWGYPGSIDCSSGELVASEDRVEFTEPQRMKIIGNSVHVEWIRQLMR